MNSRIQNLVTDPHVIRNPRVYKTEATQQTNGVWRVTLQGQRWGTFARSITVQGETKEWYTANPCVYYLRYRKSDTASLKVYRGGTQCARGEDWLAWLVNGSGTEVNPVLELGGPPETAWVEPLEHGCYTTTDWERLTGIVESGQIPHPWFAGDTYPK